MCPKAKSDQVITHRFELQTKEREALDMIAASTAVKNVGEGVGAVIAPFGEVLSVVVGAWIAKEGFEKMLEQWSGIQAEAKTRFESQKHEAYIESGSEKTYEEWSATGAPARASWWRRRFYDISFGVIGDP
jgi:hypothetical protein